ncbi:recombinase family protein [Candidatus Peregrinibacteria bacterium]|nr:recombinase family protein [Candidatus Peregrinibacteria bacterium]MBI3816073.1 recombinase family protein [Candidatus Peregrinibacteria bacterium]
MKVIIYNRKSLKDKEDQQVLSIQGQKEENAKRVQQGGHEIIDEYDEEQTAKKPGRPKINEMLARIEAGEADAIVCWRLNRLARNPIDGGRIQWLLQTGVIKAIITSEKTYTPADNVIQMAVEFGMATQYSIDLSEDVKRGMRQKVNMGWKPGRPALGYLRDDARVKGAKQTLDDPERFDLVRQMWDDLLSRAYTVPEIWQRAVDHGLTQPGSRRNPDPKPLHLSTVYRVFTNNFYCGGFEWDGKMCPGKHVPMITVEEYDLAQEILGHHGKPRRRTHDNPYPGLVHCGECGGMIVADFKSKVLKGSGEQRHYCYFRCANIGKVKGRCLQKGSLKEDELKKQLLRLIDKAEIPQSLIEWSLKKLKCSQEDRMERHKLGLQRLQDKEKTLEEKIDNLIDLRVEDPSVFTPESFKRKMQELEKELEDVRKKHRDHVAAAKTWRESLIGSLEFLETARLRFTTGYREDRLEILHRLGQTIELRDQVLTFALREPFMSFSEAKEELRKKIGSLEPLNCGLDKVRKSVLEKVIPVWLNFYSCKNEMAT